MPTWHTSKCQLYYAHLSIDWLLAFLLCYKLSAKGWLKKVKMVHCTNSFPAIFVPFLFLFFFLLWMSAFWRISFWVCKSGRSQNVKKKTFLYEKNNVFLVSKAQVDNGGADKLLIKWKVKMATPSRIVRLVITSFNFWLAALGVLYHLTPIARPQAHYDCQATSGQVCGVCTDPTFYLNGKWSVKVLWPNTTMSQSLGFHLLRCFNGRGVKLHKFGRGSCGPRSIFLSVLLKTVALNPWYA